MTREIPLLTPAKPTERPAEGKSDINYGDKATNGVIGQDKRNNPTYYADIAIRAASKRETPLILLNRR
jgi:hypothetical protein